MICKKMKILALHSKNKSSHVTYPNVTKYWAVGTFAVSFEVLGHNCRYGHGDTNEAVVIYTNPDDIKPRQTTLR